MLVGGIKPSFWLDISADCGVDGTCGCCNDDDASDRRVIEIGSVGNEGEGFDLGSDVSSCVIVVVEVTAGTVVG